MTDTAKTDWDGELRTLLKLRLIEEERKQAVARAWDAVMATKEYRWWVAQTEAKKYADREVADFEGMTRLAAVAVWRETGETNIAPGLAIRMMKLLDYTDADALRYCKAGLDAAITFDRKVFEKVMLSMDADVLPSFVVRDQKPTATIATDLEKVLAKDQD